MISPMTRGHPGQPNQGKVKVTVYLPEELEREIRAQAEEEIRPFSDRVHYLLRLGLQAKRQRK